MPEAIQTRTANEDDINFILSSWIHSYQESKFAALMQPKVYFQFHRPIVEGILARKTTVVRIAGPIDDPELIYGYAVFEQIADFKVFHYMYVKRAFGKFGISKQLMAVSPFEIKKGVYASHMSYIGEKIVKKYELIYCPYFV